MNHTSIPHHHPGCGDTARSLLLQVIGGVKSARLVAECHLGKARQSNRRRSLGAYYKPIYCEINGKEGYSFCMCPRCRGNIALLRRGRFLCNGKRVTSKCHQRPDTVTVPERLGMRFLRMQPAAIVKEVSSDKSKFGANTVISAKIRISDDSPASPPRRADMLVTREI